MTPVQGGPSNKYSGIFDNRFFQEVLERIEKLEKAETERKPIITARQGNLTLKAVEEKELTESPEIIIPRTGEWLLSLGIRGRTSAAGLVELQAGPSVNGGAYSFLYDFVTATQFGLSYTTNSTNFNLKAGDKITVKAKIFQPVESVFDFASLIAVQLF